MAWGSSQCGKELAVHQIELVVDAREDFGDGRAVGDHTAGTHDLGQITTRHHCRRLVVDAALEAGRAPVHKLDGALGLDGSNCCIHILWYNVPTVPDARLILRLQNSVHSQTSKQRPPKMLICEHAYR